MYIDLHPALSFHQLGRRNNQEDARYPDSDAPSALCRTFVVCDGVGGLDKGEVASHTVAATLGAAMECYGDPATVFTGADFAEVLAEAYRALACQNQGDATGMATTMTFVHFHAGGVFTAYIGDSRIYQIRPGAGVVYRSYDHSLVNALVRTGNLSPAGAVGHPKSNVITRCMGGPDPGSLEPAMAYDITDVRSGDYFLLCSDGVLHGLDDEALCELLESSRSDFEKIETLAAVSADSTDNNTAILIHVAAVADPGREDAGTDGEDGELPPGSPTMVLDPVPPMATDIAPAARRVVYADPDDDYDGYPDDDPDYQDDEDDDDGSDSPMGNFFRRIFS